MVKHAHHYVMNSTLMINITIVGSQLGTQYTTASVLQYSEHIIYRKFSFKCKYSECMIVMTFMTL